MASSVQQDDDDHNLNHRSSRSSTSTQSSNACSKHTSYYEPCECLDWGDGNIKLDCKDISRDKSADTKVSRILKDSLSDSASAQLRTLDLVNNQLTQVPRELSKFHRLQNVDFSHNNIHSIYTGAFHFIELFNNELDLSYNGLSHIEDGAFQGK